MFVGMGRGMESLLLARVGARGVRRVHYHTEPLQQTCLDVTATTLWDEVWHYTLHNAALCWQSSARRGAHRYVPPGGLDADFLGGAAWVALLLGGTAAQATRRTGPAVGTAAQATRRAGPAVFLGVIPKASTPDMPGYARRACYGALARELGTSLVHRENAFTMPEIRWLLRSH